MYIGIGESISVTQPSIHLRIRKSVLGGGPYQLSFVGTPTPNHGGLASYTSLMGTLVHY